jgi:hypothetical protein
VEGRETSYEGDFTKKNTDRLRWRPIVVPMSQSAAWKLVSRRLRGTTMRGGAWAARPRTPTACECAYELDSGDFFGFCRLSNDLSIGRDGYSMRTSQARFSR